MTAEDVRSLGERGKARGLKRRTRRDCLPWSCEVKTEVKLFAAAPTNHMTCFSKRPRMPSRHFPCRPCHHVDADIDTSHMSFHIEQKTLLLPSIVVVLLCLLSLSPPPLPDRGLRFRRTTTLPLIRADDTSSRCRHRVWGSDTSDRFSTAVRVLFSSQMTLRLLTTTPQTSRARQD